MEVLNIIALIIVTIGSINWGLIGIFNFNLLGKERNMFNSIIYILVFVSIIWLIVSLFISGGSLDFIVG